MVSTSLKPLNETMIAAALDSERDPVAQLRGCDPAMGYFWRYAGNTLFLCV